MIVGWTTASNCHDDAEGGITFARLESVCRRALQKRTLPILLGLLEPMQLSNVANVDTDKV
jgi:hypothetical protein